MDRSRLSNVISVTRLLPHFSRENVDTMKSCIFEQLECDNESQFLCKALQSLCKTLSVESTCIIKQKAIQIADSQHITQSKDDNHITVCKYIQSLHNDAFSGLHSDIIDYFGTFLNKKQSIEFGYLNKQLYIETQKHSYLIKRCNDACLSLENYHIDKMLLQQSDGFDYSFGKHLSLSINKPFNVSNIISFNNFFSRLSSLKCFNFSCLSYVPLNALFNSRHNYYQNGNARNSLSELRIEHHRNNITQESIIEQVNIFCNDLKNYQRKCTNTKSMRNIGKFQLVIPSYIWDADEKIALKYELVKKLLLSCGCIADCIYLGDHTKITIDKVKELKMIFHDNLTCFGLGREANLIFKNNNNTITGNTANINDKNENQQQQQREKNTKIGMLKTIGIEATDNPEANNSLFDTLKSLDTFSMRRNVQCYIIEWDPSYDVTVDPDVDLSIAILNKIFFKDYDKHESLKEIKITCHDVKTLFNFAKLLYYFHQHYQQLFVETKFYLKHLEKIEVNFTKVYIHPHNGLIEQISSYSLDYGGMSIMFDQTSDKAYPIDKKVIEITNVKQGIESFGIIYQNIAAWLKARQIQYGKNYYEDPIKDCKVVLVLPA